MAKEFAAKELGDVKDEQMIKAIQVAEQAERYQDMMHFVSLLVAKKKKDGKTMNTDERNLLSVAYKNVVGPLRQSWRSLSEADFEKGDGIDVGAEAGNAYKSLVEQELESVCKDILKLLEESLIDSEDDWKKKSDEEKAKETGDKTKSEEYVFYCKMAGDYYRYMCEVFAGEEYKKKCLKYYDLAMERAKASLPETHPTRLGLALNYSVCNYEIVKGQEGKAQACKLAKEAFDQAIEKLDSLNDSSYKDSTLIMQLLRDNLTLWTSTDADAGDEQ